MASNVIDYFATLGRKSLICKSFESLWTNDKLRTPSEIWNEAITDIAIVHPGEQLPDSSWQLINRSIDNRQITSRSTIAIRRRGASGRLDHITKVRHDIIGIFDCLHCTPKSSILIMRRLS